RAALAARATGRLAEKLGHHAARGHPARQCLAVLAVGANDVVVGTQRRDGADRHGLLADVQVAEAADLANRICLARALLEAADQQHHPEPVAILVAVTGPGFSPRSTFGSGCHQDSLAALAWSLCSQAWYDERVRGDACTCAKPIERPMSRSSSNSAGV